MMSPREMNQPMLDETQALRELVKKLEKENEELRVQLTKKAIEDNVKHEIRELKFG